LAKIISVTSGKGGVGKTLTALSFGFYLAEKGSHVLIFDADIGLANINILLNIRPRHGVNHMIEDGMHLKDIVVSIGSSIDLLPATSGIVEFCQLNNLIRDEILGKISYFLKDYDYLIIDTGAGLSDDVLSFNEFAEHTVIATTTEPHAITDAYATLKVLHERKLVHRFYLLVNMVRFHAEGYEVFSRIAETALKFLQVELIHIGNIPKDQQIRNLIKSRSFLCKQVAQTVAGQAWRRALCRLEEYG